MMDTPIWDFVRDYAEKNPLRLHMPGHKGISSLGPEAWDITEVEGADVLYHAGGIIRKSEENTAGLFGTAATFYSAEGSSLCIRAMVYLALLQAGAEGRKALILAGRNAHKTFLTAAALLDVEVEWLRPEGGGLLSCPVTVEELERAFNGERKPTAVYLTAPDYLGNLVDIQALAEVCHRHGALLLVDNAHGSYLHFLPAPCHPMDLGADLCCDSAHKTLPVLTGGAYLHVSKTTPVGLRERGETALSLFASTSPSYLVLQSLDRANRYLAESFREELAEFSALVEGEKERLIDRGWKLAGGEPLKVTLAPKGYGYTGLELAERMREAGMEAEFADPDFLVLMLTPGLGRKALERVERFLSQLPRREGLREAPPVVPAPAVVMSPRQAIFSPQEELPVEECLGRVLASPTVSCPPAVPILVCGEVVDEAAVACFRYYGIERCCVVK